MPEPRLDVLGKRLGNWKVLLSPKALKSIQSLGRSGNFGSIEEKLRDLASGSWSYHLAGSEEQRKKLRIPLATTRCNWQIFILWQVDIASDDTTQTQSQVVKIWEIGAKTELSQPIDRVIILQKSYSAEHVTHCHQKPLEDSDKNLLPKFFHSSLDAAKPAEEGQGLDIRTVDREVLQMANRFYTLTEPMIRSVLANDLWAEFPFDFSGDETRIILHFDTSNLILGRSGTGKTTCLVFKLLAKYAASCAFMEERSPRQLLLTRSTELANKLKDYIDRLMRTLPTKNIDPVEQQERELPLLHVEDDDDQPYTVFNLLNDSFPFVCTFDRLLELLENTVEYVDREGFPVTNEDADVDDALGKDQSDKSDTSEEEYPRWQPSTRGTITQFVDFQSFRLDYWPRFPAALVKNLPIELAFAEIMGVIQGSISSRETLKPLSRQAYLELSSRVAPTFTLETEKSRIYDLFEKYQDLKLHRREMDGVDRVTKLIKAVRDNQRLKSFLGAKFDEIYIDEVQDLRCLDIELLLSILKESRAFHIAGDTAQTISQDSHFRFQDIKALFYDHFVGAASLANQPDLSRPRLFMLAKNYRSHQGILGLASLVIEMLWNGFPQTVDKLEPEIGQIHGPIPVFFLNCNVQILASTDTPSDEHPKQTLDFGAEQAIIVRDQSTKVKLQAELKEQALILTVLQSKGMEFEDVFLWNFFTDSPCPGGWRCLETLKTRSGNFDSKKHAAMCSELKQFYVAVTRARIHLSIVESEEALAARVADLLKRDASSPLVEVTTSSDPDFLKELMSLRSISHDPERWSDRGQELMQRKQYDDAVICFRRAKDKRGETCATAYIFEETGRRLASSGDAKAARDCFRSAIQNFMELEMVAEAARRLEKMEEYKEAAWLWARYGEPGKAAPLFSKASMFSEASDHYHQAHSYDKAADALRQGELAENLVSYVIENQKKLSSRSFRSHSRFCILLLKQGKIGSYLLTPAIKLLGSLSEQEQAFIAYEMHDQLADLYADQRKFKERLLLLSRIGKLDHALKAITDLNLSETNTKSLEGTIRRVQDYYFAGRIVCPRLNDVHIPAQLRSSNSDWISAQRLITSQQRDSLIEKAEAMRNGVVKDFLRLYTLLNLGLLDMVPTLDGIPFNAIEAASRMAEIISSLTERTRDPLTLLLTGVMEVDHETKPFILLTWSPLHEAAANLNANEYPRLANQWFLNKFGSMMLRLDAILRNLWRSEWPVRCAYFLTRGFCNGIRDHSCLHLHEKVKASDCSKKLSLLIKINATFCSLTAMHRKKLMDKEFQERFSGLRRYWLESLLRELIFVSSFEQFSQAMIEAQSKILSASQNPGHDKGLSVLAANIEDLLFHRLGKELIERSNISSSLEQIQVSQILDYNVQERFARYLSNKLSRSTDMQFQQRQLWALRNLESNLGNPDALAFRQSLRQFTSQIPLADVKQFSSFHSVTTVFEFFAAYLVIRSCRVAVLIPQSWIDIHLPWFAYALLAKEASNDDLRIYADSLLELTTCYCQLLSRLGSLLGPVFRLGLSNYPSRLLHQRNMELLALVVVNLGFSSTEVEGFKEVWRGVCQVFSLPYTRGFHLQHTTIPELLEKLVKSYRAYDGKDCIKLVRKTNGQHAAENKLQKLGVQAVSLIKLISTTSVSHGLAQTPPSNETEAQYSHCIKAALRIQQFWRSHYPTLLAKRTFLETPVGRLYVHVLEICKQNAASKTMRYLLTGYGVGLLESIRSMSSTASELQQLAVNLLISLPQEKFEHIDEVIQRVSSIEESLENVAKIVSMDRLEELAKGGSSEAQRLFRSADSMLGGVANDLSEARRMMEPIEGGR